MNIPSLIILAVLCASLLAPEKIIHADTMSSSVDGVIYGEEWPEMFFKSVPESPL